jgi:hypothetical protein
MNRIFINNNDVTADILDFKEFDIEIGLNTSTKTITKSLSQPIRFTGDTYEYLKTVFFTSCDNYDKVVKAIFKTDICGGITIPLEITVESLEIFPDLEEIEVLLKSVSDVERSYDYLDSTYWFENDFIEAYEIPIVYYADQPNLYSFIIVLFTLSVRLFLKAVDTSINAICKVVTLGTGECNLDITGKVFSKLDTWLTGLGRWSTAPLMREILDYHCVQAGLNFSSSILQDEDSEYYNMAMFILDRGVRGSYKDTTAAKRKYVLLENAPLYTVIDLLEKLKTVFEAEYRIIGDTLYFENEEYFDNLTNIKLFNIKDKCLPEVGYSYKMDDLVAFGEFLFSQDSYDAEGNKTLRNYSLKLDFNIPYSSAQKGKLSRLIEFGGTRFMFDQLSHAKDGFFDWERQIDEFRDGPESFFENLYYNNEGVTRRYDLILAGNTLLWPKLLVLEPNFKRSDALTIKKPFKKINGKQFWIYNYPMMYKEIPDFYEEDVYTEAEFGLLKPFADTANPRLKKDKMYIASIPIDCDCSVVTKAIDTFQNIYIQTPFGKGIPTNINISFKSNKIDLTINDIRILCNT